MTTKKFPNLVPQFLEYVKFETQSCRESSEEPSSPNQLKMAEFLVDELKSYGLKDAHIGKGGVVYASSKATKGCEDCLPIGLIAHMDTSPDAPAVNIKPQIIRIEAGDVLLNPEKQIYFREEDFPEIKKYVGEEVIFTDGTTLLGADDKAGIAAITACMAYLKDHPEVAHAKICVAFTPDEEIAKGTVNFDIPHFGADYAYTFDGGEIGTLETENFNAATAMVTIKGVVVHPGLSKGKMVNSIKLASRLIDAFPEDQAPETTEGYEGFIHPNKIEGTVAETSVRILIRDHDKEKFEAKKSLLKDLVRKLAEEEPRANVSLTIKDSYENMRPYLDKTPKVMEIVREAYRLAGIPISEEPIRGGTDGARLSVRGLPCPNVFTGGLNYHSVYECVPVPSLEAAAEVALSLVKLSAAVKTLK
ncbi:peptidase T [Parasutterella excrementihominis]|jgi:tripeptide aminopeptidase|uniref:peptidase T n=1 Tax=Parasutterella excrementihominis TaxID=487175 RepID=UPI002666964C|nr:peptidase T [Parasutterella excrementihominis]